MNTRAPLEGIHRLVDRLARRIRLQRAIDGLVTGLTFTLLGAMLALVLFKTGWIGMDALMWTVGAGGLGTALLTLWGWFARLDRIALAQRIDHSHRLHDRLSTALSLEASGVDGEFTRAQLADAARHAEGLEIGPAAPFRRPVDLVPFVIVALALAGLAVLRPPSHEHPLPPPFEIRHDAVLDAPTVALERERLEDIKAELEGIEDSEAKELVAEIEELLDAVESREISEGQFLDELDRLEKEYFEKTGKEESEKLAEALKAAAEKLEQEAKEDIEQTPEAKALVDALKKEDLAGAAKALDEMAEKMNSGEMSAEEAERMAKLLEKFSSLIDPTDPALQELIKEHEETLEKLARSFDMDNLSEDEKQRLDRAKDELDRLKDEQRQQEESEASRRLKKIKRSMKEASDRAEKVVQGNKGEREANSDEKMNPDYEREAGRKVDEAQREMKEGSEEQRSDKAKEMARRQLDDLREAMQRARGGSRDGDSGDSQDQGRGEQMKDFLRRAKGEPGEGQGDGNRPDEGEPGQPGQNPGEAGKKKRGPHRTAETGQGGDADAKGSREGQSFDDVRAGDGAGKGAGDRRLGEETQLDGERKDVKVEGQMGKGPSRAEVIRTASEEGFATRDYKDVFVDYERVVEEVMDKEDVPAGYRYYIKRYFQLIKPQED